MRMNLFGGKAMAGLYRHDRHADFAPLLAGDADHGGFGHCLNWCSTLSTSAG